MAGGPRVPAGEAPPGAIRLSAPVGDLSRQHLVRVILHCVLGLVVLGTLVSALGSPGIEGALPIDETLVGVLFCGVIFILLVVNRLGFWKTATWGLLTCLVLSGSIFFNLASLDRVFIVSAIPALVAAFLLRPAAAFELAALSAGCYTVVWFRHGQTPGFNWLSLMVLAGVALVSWLAARRVAWLEEADDISRRELDRLADERDVLKGQVRALADEVNRLREADRATGLPGDSVRRP